MEQKHATTFTKPNTNALCCTCGQTLPPLHQIPSLSQKTAQLRRSHNRRLHPTLQRPLWVKSRMPQDSKGEKRRGERQGNLAHDVQANSGQSARRLRTYPALLHVSVSVTPSTAAKAKTAAQQQPSSAPERHIMSLSADLDDLYHDSFCRRLFARACRQKRFEMPGRSALKRSLGPLHLTLMGVGASIGAGIFVFTGVAAREAGLSLS